MRLSLRSGVVITALVSACNFACAQGVSTNPAMDNPTVVRPDAAPERGANSFAESQARSLVESQGYSDVSALVNDKDGVWRGTAKKAGTKVGISVDYKGHVTARPQ
jgi:hypothetical protein